MAYTPDKIREMNKVCRSIYKRFGKFYGNDVREETELQERFREAVKLSDSSIIRIIRNLNNATSVQLCFLMDSTGSMQKYIDEVKNCITTIVETIQDKCENAYPVQSFAVAFVGYRDIGDEKRFEVLDFVKDIDEFLGFCNSIVADGGGDAPEDVFGGLNEVIQLSWIPKYGTHVLFHIADSPCHGREYHEFEDDYPDGDPDGKDIQNIFEEINEKKIHYYFGKIESYTDMMIEKFSDYYKEPILTFEVRKAAAICNAVAKSIELSVSKSVKDSVLDSNPKCLKKKIEVDKKVPNWKELETVSCKLLCYELPPNIEYIIKMDPLTRKPAPCYSVKIAPKPFAYGSERLAYYGLDDKLGVEIVLKEMLFENMRESIHYETRAQMQTIAAFLALEFNEVSGESRKIVVLEPRLIYIEKTGKTMAVEKKLKNPKFVRFQNNAGYTINGKKAREVGVSQYVDLMMAFTHWTNEITKQKLMVVDIQGAVDESTGDFLITDPAIHCTDPTLYRPLNLGEKGFLLFYQNHKCNKICKHLKLKEGPPSWVLRSSKVDPLVAGPGWLSSGGFAPPN